MSQFRAASLDVVLFPQCLAERQVYDSRIVALTHVRRAAALRLVKLRNRSPRAPENRRIRNLCAAIIRDSAKEQIVKLLLIALLFVLAGCAAGPTLEQLESQAMLTGDWSAVERRERSIERRRQRAGIQCPSGMTAYCEAYAGHRRCTCISSSALSSVLWR